MSRSVVTLLLLGIYLGFVPSAVSLADTVQLHFFYAENCASCREEKPFIEALQQRYPQLQVQVHDVWMQRDNFALMEAVTASRGIDFASTPTTAVGQRVWFGYNETTAAEIEAAVKECLAVGCVDLVATLEEGNTEAVAEVSPPVETADTALPVDPEKYSLPAFTIILGLLDSFNPCAFFVLLFLLSLMVHTHSRQRMLLVGGVFIFFSGLLYFFFMAAWLNLFLLAGRLPLLTSIAGLLALVIALLNIKDHFAFQQGPSLSLSESAKPKLFTRMRNLLKGDRLLPTLVATTILALVANSYELLCTAGFPMVYTRVLTLHELPAWLYYLYLGLYNLAYVVPLLVIVSICAFTLGSHKLSEFEGRALKLTSGMMMLALGLVLLLRPLLLQNLLAVLGLLAASLLASGLILLVEKYLGGARRNLKGKTD